MSEKKKSRKFEFTIATAMIFSSLTWGIYNLSTAKPSGYNEYKNNISCINISGSVEEYEEEKKEVEKKMQKKKTKDLQQDLDEIIDTILYRKGRSRKCLEDLRKYEKENNIEPYGLSEEREKEIMSWDYYIPKKDPEE